MAGKWKYSTLSAAERLERVRGGDKDVYDSEIGRSLDVIRSREELGLDISDQKAWIDALGREYNRANAEKMGFPASLANETGYADALLGAKVDARGHKKSGTIISTTWSDGGRYAKLLRYQNELLDRIERAEAAESLLEEWMRNNGIAADSGEAEKIRERFREETDAKLEPYRRQYIERAEKLGFRFK